MVESLRTGWKDIGSLFGVSASTVRRWYSKYDMPIHFGPGGKPSIDPTEGIRWFKEGKWKPKKKRS